MLENIKKVYMIGIKGTGMSTLAVNLKQMGLQVSGSDSAESFFTDQLLRSHKITVKSPFHTTNVPKDADLVIVSTAYTATNPEVAEALKQNLTIKTYPEVLGLLSDTMRS